MQRDGLTFPEALRSLAAKAGVELDERTSPRRRPQGAPPRGDRGAIAFYHAVLTGSKAGEPALDYLRGRGFTDETIAKYQLGWAPGGWDTMTRQLAEQARCPRRRARRGRPAQPRQSGGAALRPLPRTGHLPDPRRERRRRRARRPDPRSAAEDGGDHGPKYLNSPATPLFDKSRTLYLIDRAKGADPQVGPGCHRRGLYGRADGAPGGLRQRRRVARNRPHRRARWRS